MASSPVPVVFCESEAAAAYWNSHSQFYADDNPSSGNEGVRRRYKVKPPASEGASKREADDRSDTDKLSQATNNKSDTSGENTSIVVFVV